VDLPRDRHPDGRPVPAQLPTDIADFTGRASRVEELRTLLSSPRGEREPGGVRLALVTGTGGLGKTTFAIHVAHLLAPQFPDGQLYVNLLGATHPVDPAEVLARFLRDFGLDAAAIPADPDERAGRYRTLLAGRRVLIVLDDARDAAQVRSLLPGSASCAVLITTRGQMPGLAGARTVDLDVLPPDEARRLFDLVAGQGRAAAEPAATEDVLAVCAGLPLAVRIAGARLATRSSWTVRALADRLADESKRLDMLRAGDLGVRASFEVSFTSLPGPETTGEVDPARAFRLLGLWTGPSISLPAASALLGEEEDAVADALDVLVDAHLLESPEPDRYRFHDLLRVYAADRARTQETEEAQQAAITRLLGWYLHTAAAAGRIISPQHMRVPLGEAPKEPALPDHASLQEALSWCDAERTGLAAATQLAAQLGLHEFAWKLPAAAMSFYYRRSHLDDWVATHRTGLASARALGDRQAEAWMLNNLGMACGVKRVAESVSFFEQALTLSREIGDTAREARAANNLANAYLDLRRFDRAEQAAISALNIDRRSGDRFGEGIALEVLGCAGRELGRPSEAVDNLQRALAIYEELDDPSSMADALSELGGTYLSLGEVADAIAYLRRSLDIQRKLGDPRHLAETLHRLGQAQAQIGELGEARNQFDEALQLFEATADTAKAANVRAALASLSDRPGLR
jgi:tetratricopeptide (TPR) repeat protein